MSIKAQHSLKNSTPDLSFENLIVKPSVGETSVNEMQKKAIETNGFKMPEFLFLRTRSDGQILDSNVILNSEGRKPQKIKDIVPKEEIGHIMQNIQQVLDNQAVLSKKFLKQSFRPKGHKKVAHFVPVSKNEVFIVIGNCLAGINETKKIGANFNTMIQMFEFLPGETLIADTNHRLLNIRIDEKNESIAFNENQQIGADIGCAHYLKAKGNCGTFPACKKCDLQLAIQMVSAENREVHKQHIRLSLKIKNQLQFKDFSLSVAQVAIDKDMYFLIYLEDKDNQKVKIKELQDANTLLRNVLDSLPFSVFWKNLNSTFLGANLSFFESNKVKHRDHIVGQRDEQLYKPDVARANQKQDEIALQIGKPLWNYERDWEDAKIRKHNFKSILKDNSGNSIGLVGTSIDLSEQNWFQIHGSDYKADHNNEFYEAVDFGIFDWFPKIDMIKGNLPFQILTGLRNQSVFLNDLLSNITEEEYAKINDIKKQILDEGGYRFTFTFEYLHPHKKSTKWLEFSGQKIYKDMQGNPIKVTCVLKDVSEKKEQELIQNNERAFLSAFLDSTKDAIWSVDRNYKIKTLNKSFKANYLMAFGVELEIGDCCLEALNESMKTNWMKRYDKALTGSAFKVVDNLNYEGLPLSAETILSPIKINDQIIGVSCFSRDISKR